VSRFPFLFPLSLFPPFRLFVFELEFFSVPFLFLHDTFMTAFAHDSHSRLHDLFPFATRTFEVVMMVQDHLYCRIIVSDILSSALCILFPPICYRSLSNFLRIFLLSFFTYTGTQWISHTHSHTHSHTLSYALSHTLIRNSIH